MRAREGRPGEGLRVVAQQAIVERVGHRDGEIEQPVLEPAPPVLEQREIGAVGERDHGGRDLELRADGAHGAADRRDQRA